ncbi:hypothetical protein KR009_003421 [Drosophila setifemur]|nr:hypothetical protein KR009_003421 [Drosophila setifemur]
MAEGKQGWTCRLILICICITMGTVLPIGYAFSVLNEPAVFIRSWIGKSASTRYSSSLSDTQRMLVLAGVVSMYVIGGLLGSPFAPLCNSRLGRRGSLMLSALLILMGAICQGSCTIVNSIELLLLGRLLGGFAAGIVYSTQPMYLVELAPAELSGSVGVFTCIGLTGGIMMGQVFSFDFALGTENLWHYALAGSAIFVIIGMLPSFWFPESPRHLATKGNREKAKSALMFLRGDEDRVKAELAEIEATAGAQGEQVTMKEVICNKKLMMPLIIVSSFHVVQQMSGISAIFYYSIVIFTDAGFNPTMAMWLNFATGMLNFVVALLGPIMMARYNRRIMMMLSCMLSAICLVLFCVGLKFMESFYMASYACIPFLLLYIIAFNMGLGPMPYFIGAEIFETGPRPVAMALGGFFNWLANFILNLCFPTLNATIGPYAFLICAGVCIYGFLLTCRYLPETRNKELKDVVPLMENGFKSKIK